MSRNGTIGPTRFVPPGHVDALCLNCKPDGGRYVVLPEESARCPHCEQPVEPLSLPSVPPEAREGRAAGALVVVAPEPVAAVLSPPAPNAAAPGQSVSLPNIREAVRWSQATDDLLAALEHEEAGALAAYEAARERVKAARRAANALRQLRGLARVDAEVPAAARGAPGRQGSRLNGRWSRKHDACVACGTTERKHKSRGCCTSCEARATRRGDLASPEETAS